MKHLEKIIAYTDGSFIRNKNGIMAGYGVYFPNQEIKNISKHLKDANPTNNRAELQAIYKAITSVKKLYTFDQLIIYTDSEYCKKSLTIWIKKWKKNNWLNSKNKPVENQDKIIKIDSLLTKYNISIVWVPAHTGQNDSHSLGNSEADKLARAGAIIGA